jgi:hypothetical protein
MEPCSTRQSGTQADGLIDTGSAIKDEEASEMCKKFPQVTQSATKFSR